MRKRSHSPLDADLERLRRLVVDEGIVTAQELAQRMGISEARIKGLANLAELQVDGFGKEGRHRRRTAKSERLDRIREHLEAGMNYRQIAAEVGLTHQRVQQIVSSEESLKQYRRRGRRVRETADV